MLDDPIPEDVFDDPPEVVQPEPYPIIVEVELPDLKAEYEVLKAASAAADKALDEAEVLRIKPLKMAAFKRWQDSLK